MIEYPINFEHNGSSVTFKNNVRLSTRQFDSLNRIRGLYTCSTPSFLWQELMRLSGEENSLSVPYEVISYKRIKKELEFLAESGFFKLETTEIVVKNRKKTQVTLTEIHPALLSIITLL